MLAGFLAATFAAISHPRLSGSRRTARRERGDSPASRRGGIWRAQAAGPCLRTDFLRSTYVWIMIFLSASGA